MSIRIGPRRTRQSSNPILGSIVLIMMGMLVIIGLSLTFMRDARASEIWPQTTGVVISSEVSSRRNGDGYSYRPRVIYEYQVDGETYTGGRITVADNQGSSRPNGAQRRVEQYPAGSEVIVSYNPAVHTQAVIEPGVPFVMKWIYRAGFAFVILGVWSFIRNVFALTRNITRLVRG